MVRHFDAPNYEMIPAPSPTPAEARPHAAAGG
jgi:hypothetical protein